MKKIYALLLVSLFLSLPSKASKPVDVSATYLGNYTKPFAVTGNYLKTANTRFKEIAGPWKTSCNLGVLGTNQTSWHVDNSKGNGMTLTSSWDGFADNVANMKIFQTITLPAGEYKIQTSAAEAGGAPGTYLVVDDADSIPNALDLATNAYKYALMSDSMNVRFTLATETKVSIGAVARATFGTWNALSLNSWVLYNYVPGVDFTALNTVLTTAKAMTAALYPTGTTPGTYPVAKWNALQTAISNGDAIVAKGELVATQTEINNQVTVINTAMAELKASWIVPFIASDNTTEYWYQVLDARTTPSYWTLGTYTKNSINYANTLLNTATPASTDNNQLFKFVKAASPKTGYYVYCKAAPSVALSENITGFIAQDATATSTITFTFGVSSKANAAIVRIEGTNDRQLNSFLGSTDRRVFVYNDVNDAGNKWSFLFVSDNTITSVNGANTAANEFFATNGIITSKNPAAKFTVYSISGQQINAAKPVTPGVYIVKSNGQTQKLVVR